jgi:HK97 family phage major capsid protein
MPTLAEQRETAVKAARELVDGAKTANRELTPDEMKSVNEKLDEVRGLDTRIKALNEGNALVKALGELAPDGTDKRDDSGRAKSLGEHFVKHAGAQLIAMKGITGASVAAPEFKANTDTQITTGSVFGPVLTQVDRTIIQAVRPRIVVADLLGAGMIAGNAVTYFVEGALEGAFTTVAEAGAKPQLHVVDPTAVTDTLKKIAGWTKFSDEMLEDLDFIVSEINQRLLYELAKFEEAQILGGNGSGTNLLGLLNRSGIQTEARGTVASGDTVADTVFRAMTKVSTGAGLDADGIVINPADYQALRLSRDANGQYYGGGYFEGQYGNGTLLSQPPLWGLRTVVTPAISAGTVLVGAFQQAATVYRKGGVRVESTNSHSTDFTSNLVTMRVEERVALAVRRPAGLVKTTVTAAP